MLPEISTIASDTMVKEERITKVMALVETTRNDVLNRPAPKS